MNFINDTLHLLKRHTMTSLRLPVWIFVSLVQPIIWLGLFGQLFKKVVEIPGFTSTSYIQFLTPGVVVMTAFFSGLWAGMGIIEDLNDGVIDRMLATPVSRSAMIAARVLHSALTVLIQSAIILLMGLALGSGLPGGIGGAAAILGICMLLTAGFAAISNGLALITRQQDTLVAIVQFFGMPLTFLSTAFLAATVMPDWIRSVTRFNPVNWSVEGARYALLGASWSQIGLNALYLGLLVVVCWYLASQCFRLYRRTM